MEERGSPRKTELLSARRIAQTAPSKGDVWLSDNHGLRGTGRLLLRITPGGTHRFYFRSTVAGQRKTIPLEPYSRTAKEGYLTLKQARTIASRHSATLERGSVEAKASLPTAVVSPASGKVANEHTSSPGPSLLDLCTAYVDDLRRRGRTSADGAEGDFNRYIAPSDIANTLAREVTAEQVTTLLRQMIERGIGRSTARLRSLLHSAYATALNAKLNPAASVRVADPLLIANPIAGIHSLSEFNVARSRVLNQQELGELWPRLSLERQPVDDSLPLRAARLSLLLGGQRAQQLVRVRVGDVDLHERTILLLDPKGRRTVARQHLLPLQDAALAEVRWLIQHAEEVGSPFLFPSQQKKSPISANYVSSLVTEIRKAMMHDKTVKAQFQFSDLRRTAETHLAQLGVSKDHRAQLQSHGLGGVQGRHYDKYEYLKEKRSALRKWEKFLATNAEA